MMREAKTSLPEVLAQASASAAVRAALARDALAALTEAGVHVSGDDVKSWLGLEDALDAELVEVLRARIVGSALADADASCGCSCAYPDVAPAD